MIRPDSGSAGNHTSPIEITVIEEDRRFTVEYSGQPLRIGRSDDCDIVLTTSKASRNHAEIIGENGNCTLVDSGSANGTRVNGEKIDRWILAPGDRIGIGSTTLVFGAAEAMPVAGQAPAAPEPEHARGAAMPVTARPARPARAAADREFMSEEQKQRSAARLRRRSSVFMNQVLPALMVLGLMVMLYAYIRYRGDEADPRGDALGKAGMTATDDGQKDDSSSREVPELTEWERAADLRPDPQEAVQGLRHVLEAARSGERGWEILRDLRDYRSVYSGTRAAEEARKLIAVLEGVQKAVEGRGRKSSETWIRRYETQERFGEALAATKLLAATAPSEADRVFWQGRTADIEGEVRTRFNALERDLGELVSAGRASEALQALVDVRAKFAGTAIFDEQLPLYVDAGLEGRAKAQEVQRAPIAQEFHHLNDRAGVAWAECRFADLPPIYYRQLALDPPLEQRAMILERLVEAHYLKSMFASFLEGVAGQPVEVSLSKNYKSRVIRANDEELESELDVSGHSVKRVTPWKKVSAAQKFALFEATSMSNDAKLGLAYFAFRNGYTEGAHSVLIRLRMKKAAVPIVDAVVAKQLGIPIPEDGFVAYRGRLVTPEQKAHLVALREQRREEERARMKELRRQKRAATLAGYIEWAKKLREGGSFETAQKVLMEIAKKGRNTAEGVEALELAEDPLLRWTTLVDNGPSENRLDTAIMGEGYPYEDDYQAAFAVSANVCRKLLVNHEPYREYESYLNFRVVQLGSKDRGVDLVERDVERDTALDGQIEWDRFTCNNGKVMGILERVYGPYHDGQAIVIGNDYAGTSTGGGGVSCMCKGSISVVAHEVGHSLAALKDEYESEPGTDPDRQVDKKRKDNLETKPYPPNLMYGSDRSDILSKTFWKYWIDAGEDKWWNGMKVSVFEGANRTPFNYWRPQSDCTMRNSGSRFCVVCMERMVLTIYRYVRPIDRVEPDPERPVIVREGESLLVKVWPMKPKTYFLDVRWYLQDLGPDYDEPDVAEDEEDDEDLTGTTGVMKRDPPTKEKGKLYQRVYRTQDAEGKTVEVAKIDVRKLTAGRYRLTCEVHDPTKWVIRDPENRLEDQRSWILRIQK